jgi:transcriptional regulator with XRE-family HTH domain
MEEKVALVKLPGGWPEDSPPRSAFLGLAPLGVSGDSFEDLASYFRRLADLHLMRPWTLALRSVAPLISSDMSTRSQRHVADTCYELSMNGVTEHAERWVKALAQLTLRNDLHLRTLLPLRDIVPSWMLLSQKERYCPLCYRDDESNRRPKYNRLLWSLHCVIACPIHNVLLIAADSSGLGGGRPFFLPGISRQDGSSLAAQTAAPATDEQACMARMVAHLLDDVHHHPDIFKGGCSPARFLSFATNKLFAGVATNFAQHLGVGKGALSDWSKGEVRPSLPRLVEIAYSCGCAVSDVILGNTVMLRRVPLSSSRRALSPKERDGFKKGKESLLAELDAIVESGTASNAKEAADQLRVSEKYLRRLAPAHSAVLVRRGAESRQAQTLNRREFRFDAFNQSFSTLAAQRGCLPPRRAVFADAFERTGIRFRFNEGQDFLRRARALVENQTPEKTRPRRAP